MTNLLDVISNILMSINNTIMYFQINCRRRFFINNTHVNDTINYNINDNINENQNEQNVSPSSNPCKAEYMKASGRF